MEGREHFREIEKVLGGASTGRDSVVSTSWRRCVETYGLDPTRPSPAHIVTQSRLREHREQSEQLVSIARSGLEALFKQVAGQNYVLLLADAKGVTVDFFGDQNFEDELRRAGLYLGADWSEDLAGTCGVGSCIVTGEAVTIHQGDHFDLTHTPLSCTAAPIFDTQGVLTAVLDISLLRSPQPKASQRLAMNLVTASARRIEMANLMARTRGNWVLRVSGMPEFLDVDPEAAVALDDSGRIAGLTHGAALALGAGEGNATLIGRRIDELLDISIDDLPDFMRDRPTEERVIRLRNGGALFGHAISPQRRPIPRRDPAVALPAALRALGPDDPTLRQVLEDAARLAPTPIPLLITGETGTGKERLARAIHVSQPGDRPFVALNCAGMPADAVEVALFGTSDGLPGMIAAADGGTLFLDEVADLPPVAQARLLRILGEGEGPRGGDGRSTRLNLRVISATRHDLPARVRDGRFREDLFFRLAAASLALPPLRLRHDFDWLIDRLLRQRSHGRADGFRLSPAARTALRGRDWPGNIRELANTLDVATALAESAVIDLPDLPAPALASDPDPAGTVEDLAALLEACDWNMAQAARRLGVDRSTVLRRVRRLGLKRPG